MGTRKYSEILNVEGRQIGYVYSMSDPKNPGIPKYIGKTTTPLRKRLGNHIVFCVDHPKYPFSMWLNEILNQNVLPQMQVLEVCEIENLQDRETHWIRFFRPLGCLTNRSDGLGCLGMKGVKPSEKNIQATIARNKLGWSKKQRKNFMASIRHKLKPIICLDTGEKFDSINDTTRKLSVSKQSLKKSLKRGGMCRGRKLTFIKKKKEIQSVTS